MATDPDDPGLEPSDDPGPPAADGEPKATWSDRLKGLLSACWARAKRIAARCAAGTRRATRAGWQWIKFRHLRHLIVEELDRHLFEGVLGLDPVTGREGVQIPLIFGGNA